MNDKSTAEQINDIIKLHGGWRAQTLSKLRALITQTSPEITEEVKWKMPSRPEGLPVWYQGDMICFAEIWKDNVKFIFTKGAHLKDKDGLFNARLKSKDIRAIEFHEGDDVPEAELRNLIQEALSFSKNKS